MRSGTRASSRILFSSVVFLSVAHAGCSSGSGPLVMDDMTSAFAQAEHADFPPRTLLGVAPGRLFFWKPFGGFVVDAGTGAATLVPLRAVKRRAAEAARERALLATKGPVSFDQNLQDLLPQVRCERGGRGDLVRIEKAGRILLGMILDDQSRRVRIIDLISPATPATSAVQDLDPRTVTASYCFIHPQLSASEGANAISD